MRIGRYRLREAIPGVKLSHWENCAVGVVTEIPPGSLLQIRGAAKLSNMLEARWRNELYAVFEADLAERSELITAIAAENSEASDGQL